MQLRAKWLVFSQLKHLSQDLFLSCLPFLLFWEVSNVFFTWPTTIPILEFLHLHLDALCKPNSATQVEFFSLAASMRSAFSSRWWNTSSKILMFSLCIMLWLIISQELGSDLITACTYYLLVKLFSIVLSSWIIFDIVLKCCFIVWLECILYEPNCMVNLHNFWKKFYRTLLSKLAT